MFLTICYGYFRAGIYSNYIINNEFGHFTVLSG